MTNEVRPVGPADAESFVRFVSRAFGSIPNDDEPARALACFEPDVALAVFDQGRIVATAGAYPLEMTLPAAGTTLARRHRFRA